MSRIVLTGIGDAAPIQAIKDLRAVTGLGLKEAREIVNRVRAGEPFLLPIDDVSRLRGAAALRFEVRHDPVSMRGLIDALGMYSPSMQVGELLCTLEVTSRMMEGGSLTVNLPNDNTTEGKRGK
jgi:hypothetical protein